jgi:hypothetical protein
MTPANLGALLFAGLSVASLGGLVLAYMLGVMPGLVDEWHPQEDRRQAEEKGAALLRSWLSPEQDASWRSHRHYFYVTGCDTGARYRIRYGRTMNIDELDTRGRVVAQWCFGPRGDLVAGDVMLAQKIALETMELEALGKANRQVYRH